MRNLLNAVVLVALVQAVACARVYPPPGGDRDRTPPRLLNTTPGPLEVVPGFQGPAVFRFDERLSERNFSEALVLVSPLDGALRVERSRTEVRVRIDGGWRPDRVYRVVLLPGVRDLFGNTRTEPAEIVFSTGPPVPGTAVAGIVLDRLTGRPPPNTVVNATRRGDTVSYMAIGDTAGFFSLRHLPMGVYDLFAFADQNRNRRRDATEPLDTTTISLGTATDTIAVVFNVLAPDTTAPRVTRAEYMDSLHVRVTFDDFIDVDEPITGAGAEVHVLPDSARYAGGARLLQAPLFDRSRREAQAAAAAADTAAADTMGVQRPAIQPPRAVPERAQPARPGAAPQTPAAPLPTREVVVELDRPLQRGATYTITVDGVANIHGLPGGGVASFETPPAPPPPPPGADVPPIPPDSSRLR
ncbi:hypothetical protein BH23GEM9_BH23GEM9_10130 [soil metagenome]